MTWIQQVQYFCSTLLLGVILGLFFHFYWSLLRQVRPGKKLITLTDVLFCFFLFLFISGALLFINAGDLRLYVWLALVAGGCLYKQCLWKPLTPFFQSVSGGVLQIGRFFLHKIARPMCKMVQTLHRLWKKLWIKGKSSEKMPPEES